MEKIKQEEKVEGVYRKFQLEPSVAQAISSNYNLGHIESIKRFEEGMINDVFSLDDKYVLKINTAQPDIPKLKKEFSVYQALPQFNVPTPLVVGFDESLKTIKFPYLVYKQIDGQTLSVQWGILEQEAQDSYMEQLGALLGKIHNLKPSNLDLPGQGEYLGLKKDIIIRINKIAGELATSKVLDEEVILRIKNFYLNSSLFDEEAPPSLLHGNYGLGNIITNNGVINGVIDWEWVSFGHNEEELAVLLYRVYKTESQREHFKEGYLKNHTISPDFEKRYFAYALLYYLKVLPSVPGWGHRPDKQKEYLDETATLIKQVGL